MHSRNNSGLAILVLIALAAVLIGGCVYERDIKTGTVSFTVTRLDDQATRNGHKYLVFTTAGVYADSDNLWHGKFTSSDLFGQLQQGHRYTCTYTGYRVPLFSGYPNLISCQSVQ